jgi:hypothetical protein
MPLYSWIDASFGLSHSSLASRMLAALAGMNAARSRLTNRAQNNSGKNRLTLQLKLPLHLMTGPMLMQ